MSDEQTTNGSPTDDRKQEFRNAYAGLSLLDLVSKMQEVGGLKEQAEDKLKRINAAYDVLRLELIPAAMENQGIENLKVAGIGRVSLTGDMYVSTVADRRPEFFEWLRDQNLGDIIQETINSSTLKAFVKNRIQTGAPVPEDFVRVAPFTRASITKGR
jgi:hypothetical protein